MAPEGETAVELTTLLGEVCADAKMERDEDAEEGRTRARWMRREKNRSRAFGCGTLYETHTYTCTRPNANFKSRRFTCDQRAKSR